MAVADVSGNIPTAVVPPELRARAGARSFRPPRSVGKPRRGVATVRSAFHTPEGEQRLGKRKHQCLH